MRKTIVFMLLLVFLAGCSLRATPTPTAAPRPTPTPTEEMRYYPTVSPEIRQILSLAFGDYQRQVPYQEMNGEASLVVWPLVSTGKFETIAVPSQNVELDVLWVLDYNHIRVPTKFPYVYGIWFKEQNIYYYFINQAFENGPQIKPRQEAINEALTLLPRGIPFLVRIGGYVTREGIDWEKCDTHDEVCRFGAYYDEQVDKGTSALFAKRMEQVIPEGWYLYGWLFDNLGTSLRIEFPDQ